MGNYYLNQTLEIFKFSNDQYEFEKEIELSFQWKY